MGYPTKIAKCCYCASKMALRLDKGRHELTCASCGAPLRDLKTMPKPVEKVAAVSHQPWVREAVKPVKYVKPKPMKKKKKSKSWKKRGSWLKDLAEDAFDFVEDIFD
jgi:hypothetical protein